MEKEANSRYLEALSFAVARHTAVRQARKGTQFPYVVHPIRVAEILDRYGYDEELVVAGLLHDTVEDAGVTFADLAESFGERVAALVESASEPDKTLDWRPRKQHTIERAAADLDSGALALVAADKLDNVRSLQETLRSRGEEETWKIFNARRKDQHWYYRTIAQTLLDREPTNLLFRTLDAEVHALFPDERRATPFFAGKPLGNPQDARAYLADPIKHWRPEYSAFELAAAWLGGDDVPPKVDSLLRIAFADYEVVEGFFEKQTKLDDLGRASQTDLLLLLRVPTGLAVVGVEGKAKESFGPLVSEWTGDPRRLAELCNRLDLEPANIQDLRYQLLHRTVAAMLEAKRYGAGDTIMLVHSFDPQDASLDDYRSFAERLGLKGAEPDKLTNSKRLDGVTLRLAWVKQR
jgi:hypothetical protein